MAKLPTRESLGPLPSARPNPRSASRIHIGPSPETEMARGVVNLGRGVSAIGLAAEAIEDHRRKQSEFETEQRFQEFTWNQQLDLDKSKREVQPGQAGDFSETWTKKYTESGKEFFKTVPPHLREKYDGRLFEVERNLYVAATTFARTEQKRASINSTEDMRENVFRPRARITPTDQLDTVTADDERLIHANPNLTPIEKDELIRKGRQAIGLSHLNGLGLGELVVARRGQVLVSPEELLRKVEGFRETAYWDVDHYRAGYGSDTVTLADGSVVKVTKDTKVTREDAERDLARRKVEFASVAERQVGDETWAALPANARAGLVSVAYNHGKLPNSVVAAVQGGDLQLIAQAVRSLPANPGRRNIEAAVILGRGVLPDALASLTDEDWQRAATHLRVLEERQDRNEEKKQKERGDEFLREAYSRSNQGALTLDYVEVIRPFVSPAEYKGLLELQKGKDNVDDPEAIVALEQIVDKEATEEFVKVANAYLRDRKIKVSTYSTLVSKNRTAARDDQPTSPYKSGRELVKTTLDPGQLLSGAAAAIGRHAQAQAMIEFDNWIAAKPAATRAESLAEAQEIVRRYQIVPYDQMKLAVGTSRYFGSKLRAEITGADLEAAEIKLYEDITAGRLTKPQQEFEVRLLNNWREILANEKKAADAAREKKAK